MIRKHNRRAAKAAFAIAFGVALILGGTTAASAAGDATATRGSRPRRSSSATKNFPEQYILGQLYKQALEAKGFKVAYKENIGSTELIDTALTQRQDHVVPGVHRHHAVGHVQAKDAPEDGGSDVRSWRSGCTGKRGQTLLAPDAVPGRRRDRGHARDRQEVRPEDDSPT